MGNSQAGRLFDKLFGRGPAQADSERWGSGEQQSCRERGMDTTQKGHLGVPAFLLCFASWKSITLP